MILKFQQGGASLAPLVSYQPVTVTGGATAKTGVASTAPKKSNSDADLTDKDLLKMLEKLDGLPNDMAILTKSLQNFYIDQKYGSGVNTSNIESRYIQILNDMKVANFNKKEYDNAFEIVSKNGGINEYAINERGQIYCINSETKDFKLMNIEELKSSKEYIPLTNSELLYYRAQSPDMANKNNILKIVKNGVSMEMVTKTITDIISKLGTTQETNQGYGKVKAGQIVSGINDFMQAVKQASAEKHNGTIHDLYKYKYLTKDQTEQANQAMVYIYASLPENMKSLLKIKSGKFSDKGATELIQTLVAAQIDTTKDFTLELEGGPTAKSNSKSNGTSKDDTDLKTSLPLNIQKGIGGVDSFIDVDRGDGIHMSVKGTQYNLINTPDGKSIMDTSLATMLNESGLQGIVKDLRNIQFGDQKLSPEALSQITYNNTGVTRANLPIKPDGSVNLELLESYEQAERELDMLRDKSPEKIKEIYDKYGILELLNSDGSYNQRKFAPFMVTEGYTTDALSGLKNSNFVKEYKGDEDSAIALIQKSLAIGESKDIQMPDVDAFEWYNPADWFGWTDTIYKGVIYIPIDNNVNAAVYGANQSLDYNEAMQQEEKYQNFEKNSNQRSTDSSVLNI